MFTSPPWTWLSPAGIPKGEGERFRANVGPAVIRKRSFRRAIHGLGALGLAKYRGRTYTGKQTLDTACAGRQTAGQNRVKYASGTVEGSARSCTRKSCTGQKRRQLTLYFCRRRTGAVVWTGRMMIGTLPIALQSDADQETCWSVCAKGTWMWAP